MTSTDKMIEILTRLKTLGLTDEQLNEVGEAFGTAQGMLQREILAPVLGPANAATVTAFGAAAAPLLPLSEELRSRVLGALGVLLLPRAPTFAEQLAPALAPVLEALAAQALAQGRPARAEFNWTDDTNPMSVNAMRIADFMRLEGTFTAEQLASFVGLDLDVVLSDDPEKLPPVYRDADGT